MNPRYSSIIGFVICTYCIFNPAFRAKLSFIDLTRLVILPPMYFVPPFITVPDRIAYRLRTKGTANKPGDG